VCDPGSRYELQSQVSVGTVIPYDLQAERTLIMRFTQKSGKP